MKYVDYYVSGLWKEGTQLHSLFLHADTPQGFEPGLKTPMRQVIEMLKRGDVIFALEWDYINGRWLNIAPLEVLSDSTVYCKFKGAGVALQNLINLEFAGTDGKSFLKPMTKKVAVK